MPYVTSEKKKQILKDFITLLCLVMNILPGQASARLKDSLGGEQGCSDGIGGGCTFQALCSGGSAQDSSKYHVAWPVGDWTA